MRKIFVAITTLAMALVMSLSSLFGCKLITTNNERDMNQVVATVQIDPSAPKETVYKKDILVDYYNYLYQALSQGQDVSGSNSQLIASIVDELVNEIVMVQYAMNYFAESGKFGAVENANKWNIETYLDDEEKTDAKYYAFLEFDNFIMGYMTDFGEDKTGDTLNETVRVVPTGATNDYEMDKDEKDQLIAKYKLKLDKNSTTFDNDRYNAFIKALNELKGNNLLGDYKNNDIETIEYFKEIEKNYQKDILLENFQQDFENRFRLGYTDGENEVAPYVDYADLQERYRELYAEQSAYSISKFEEALSTISAEKPILKGQAGYGMVYHILLKPDDEVIEKVEELKEEYGDSAYKNSKYVEARAKLFSDVKAKDQRKTWIQSHYDFDGTYFTGDYTLYESDPLQFYGQTTLINDQDKDEDNYREKYRVDSVKEFSLQEFLNLINEYLYDNSADVSFTGNIDRNTFTATKVNSDYDKRVKELMFAFSQDDGDTALNTYKGYAIKPTPDTTEEEEWVLEFAEEGRNLIKEDQKTFKVVATDYGYHIMFFSENFANVDYDSLEKYLTTQYGIVNKENKYLLDNGFNAQTTTIEEFIEDWDDSDYEGYWEAEYNAMVANWYEYKDTTNYLYVLQSALSTAHISNEYTNLRQDIFQNVLFDSNKVVKYEDAYKDLIGK